MKSYFKPEFLNRLDDIIVFNPLKEENLVKIVDIMFKSLQSKLLEREIKATLTQNAKNLSQVLDMTLSLVQDR